jgi:hypothetical protein
MTAVLLWKEYRQQRAIWLALLLLALLVVGSLLAFLGPESGLRVSPGSSLASGLSILVYCLVITYGLVSGAVLLAGEKEEGTLPFLDNLSGWRRPLWKAKVGAGSILTLSLSTLLTALAVGLGFASWEMVLSLPLLGLDALAWGLLGGALCRTVLTAILTSIGLMALSWSMIVPATAAAPNYIVVLLIETVGGVVAAYASRRIFCRLDFYRQPLGAQLVQRFVTAVTLGWRALFWLALRQGWPVLAAGLLGALVLGVAVHLSPLVLLSSGTLLLGLACGLMAFSPDQRAVRFLESQRLPPGRLWMGKIAFWGAALLVQIALTWYMIRRMEASSYLAQPVQPQGTPQATGLEVLIQRWTAGNSSVELLDPLLLVWLWPVYGFCFGQCFGLVLRRPVLALILAAFVTPLVIVLWVPSLLIGGVTLWQAAVLPVLLLLTSRLAVWPWISGRLGTGRPLLGLVGAAVLMVLSLVGFLWYRVAEVPDVGEPFDVKAFVASLPPPEKNEAGLLVRRALADMTTHRRQVESELGQPPDPEQLFRVITLARAHLAEGLSLDGAPFSQGDGGYAELLNHVLRFGWPQQDQAVGRWLDRLFAGEWVGEAERAARMPLGVVEDPRLAQSDSALLATYQSCLSMARLFAGRALQLEARGDLRGALNQLETLLGLSRQVRHAAPYLVLEGGNAMEASGVWGLGPWLEKIGPDKELLRASLALLKRYEAALPDFAECIKSEYLIRRAHGPSFRKTEGLLAEALLLSCQVPWEKERLNRILNGIFMTQFHALGQPYARWRSLQAQEWSAQFAPELCRIPMAEVALYQDSFTVPSSKAYSELRLRVAGLAIHVALYQADHGHPPAKLDDLVPGYVNELPVDPLSLQRFEYVMCATDDVALILFGASTVGLAGSPWGQGALSAGTALVEPGNCTGVGGVGGDSAGFAGAAGPGPGAPGGPPVPGAGEESVWFETDRLALFKQALGLRGVSGLDPTLVPGQRCVGDGKYYFPVPVWSKK